jgi:hypothetical protein
VSVQVTRFLVSLGPAVATLVLEAGTGMQGWWSSWRQSWPGMVGARRGSLSVELGGAVKWSSTVLPMRATVRLRTGCGRRREGARGGPGLAQPTAAKTPLRIEELRSKGAVRPSLRRNKSMAMSLAFWSRVDGGGWGLGGMTQEGSLLRRGWGGRHLFVLLQRLFIGQEFPVAGAVHLWELMSKRLRSLCHLLESMWVGG